jgi:hypothetical protein
MRWFAINGVFQADCAVADFDGNKFFKLTEKTA